MYITKPRRMGQELRNARVVIIARAIGRTYAFVFTWLSVIAAQKYVLTLCCTSNEQLQRNKIEKSHH